MSGEIPVRILFLAADPSDASRLRLGQELRDIKERLRIAKESGKYQLEQRESVRIRDITQAIFDVEPHIIHFSGHGTVSGELCFEDEVGKVQSVKPDDLAAMFKLFVPQVNCVVLNACYSEIQAKAIAEHIPFVIGMNDAIGDDAAIAFAVGFYKALAANRSIKDAYKFGCVEIQLQGIPEHLKPVIYIKKSPNSVPIQEPEKPKTNPFVPQVGRVEDSRLFFGREREIQRVFEVLESGSSVAVIGEEGIGKSSLLWAICQQAESHLLTPRQPVFLDLNEIGNESDFYIALCDKLSIPECKGYKLTRNLRQRSQKVLLAIDNVAKFTWKGFTRQVRDQLRALAEGNDAPLQLILAASEPLDNLFNDSHDGSKTSPLAGICQEEHIKRWDENTMRTFIANRLAGTGVSFREEDITQLIQQSGGLPKRLMQLCYRMFARYNVLDNANTLPQAEQRLIVDIAETWKEALLSVVGEVGEISITKPIRNPYIIGDPVIGERFVGREDVMRQLEELWLMGQQLQSVVIYGHRRMGKTSILRNAANLVGSGVKIAYVNMLEVGDAPSGVGEVLIAISDAVSRTVNLHSPTDEELLNLPLPTFRRYLQRVIETLDDTSLIIALDEFEKIEDLIEAGKIPVDFMGFLRGMLQMSSKVAIAFAGLHTLEEMTADYFQPFFASVIPIHINFQKRAATRQILANPDEDFPLDYTPEALDRIYDLTHGQPFLVQLVGFQLVRRYNDQVFEQQRPRDHVFTVEDVEAVINDAEFFKRGRYYFDGVWGQAARGAAGQQAILRAIAEGGGFRIAPHLEGLSLDALSHSTGIDKASLQPALQTLKRHDVIEEIQGHFRITVELFRRWVL